MAGRAAIIAIFGTIAFSAPAHGLDDAAAIPGLLPDSCAAAATDQIEQADPPAGIAFALGESEDPFELLMTAAHTRAGNTGQSPDAAALEILRATVGEVIVEDDVRMLLDLLRRLWQRGEARAAILYGQLLAQWPALGDVQPSADDSFIAASVALGAEGMVALARYRVAQAGSAVDAAALEAQARALLWARVSRGDCGALVDLAWVDLEPVQGNPRVEQGRALLQLAAMRGNEPAAIALATLHLEPAWNVFDPVEAIRVLEAAVASGSDAVRVRLAALRLKGPLPVRDREAGIEMLRTIAPNSAFAADVALLLAEDAAGRFGGPFEPEMVAEFLAQAEAHLDRRVEPWLAVARAYREGWSGAVAPESAERLYQILADRGNPAGLLGVAELGLLRDGPSEASVRLVRQAAEMGSLEAIQRLFELAAAGSARASDLPYARALLERAARSGSGSAALTLSRMLLGESILRGEIGLRDQAIAALEEAVRAGSVEASLDLARAYETGLAGVVDIPRSQHLYETALAADSAGTDAMLEIGRAYLGTTGLGPRFGSAAEWFRRCTMFGDTRCLAELGKMGRSPGSARYLEPGEAERALIAGATVGHSQSMFELAQMLDAQGRVDEARYWLERSAERGHTGAMLAMVSALRDNPASLDAAVHWFELARAHATTGISGLLNIGRAYRSGVNLPRDPDVALGWFEQAARLGSPVAMREVGLWYLRQPELAARGPAETWLSHAVTLGDTEAMEHLSEAYRLGLLGEPRPADAYRLALLAAHRGSVPAKMWTAQFLIEGYGTPRDPSRALAWLREASVAGDPAAMSTLGQMLLTAATTNRDSGLADEGMDWLRRAADAGDREALFTLGQMYEAGRFVGQDPSLAAALYEAAAAAGHLEAIVTRSALIGETEGTE